MGPEASTAGFGDQGAGLQPPGPAAWGSSPWLTHPPWAVVAPGPGQELTLPLSLPWDLWHKPQGCSAPAPPGPRCQLCPIPAEPRSLQRPGPLAGPVPVPLGRDRALSVTIKCWNQLRSRVLGILPANQANGSQGVAAAPGCRALCSFPCSCGQLQLKLSSGHINFLPTVSRMFLL